MYLSILTLLSNNLIHSKWDFYLQMQLMASHMAETQESSATGTTGLYKTESGHLWRLCSVRGWWAYSLKSTLPHVLHFWGHKQCCYQLRLSAFPMPNMLFLCRMKLSSLSLLDCGNEYKTIKHIPHLVVARPCTVPCMISSMLLSPFQGVGN